MLVYIVRHGQSEGNLAKKNCGWKQFALSELGHAQARHAGELLQGIQFDRVYCSDLLRAIQTCEDALPGVTPIYTDAIREVSVGRLEDVLCRESMERYGEIYREAIRRQDFSFFGGESSAQMKCRVWNFVRELEKLSEGCAAIAVFGHEGTVHQMLNYCMGHDILLEHFEIRNASVTVLEYSDKIWSLKEFAKV